MNTQELKSRLRAATPLPEHRGDCPADEILAAYVEGGMSEADHATFERHLADCGECMALVGLLGRAREHEVEADVPELVHARARRLAGTRPPAPASRHRALRWAAAAAVVLAVTLSMQGLPPRTAPDAGEARTVRNIEPLALQPRLLWPVEGAVVDIGELAFDWSPVADSVYYQLRVVTDSGDLVWQQQVPGTHWRAPPQLLLTPGTDYFVRVDAFLTESKSVSSGYVAFRLAGQH